MTSVKLKENLFVLMSVDILTTEGILQMLINKYQFSKQQRHSGLCHL